MRTLTSARRNDGDPGTEMVQLAGSRVSSGSQQRGWPGAVWRLAWGGLRVAVARQRTHGLSVLLAHLGALQGQLPGTWRCMETLRGSVVWYSVAW